MGSSESTGPLAEELEMTSQGPNDDTYDYQRLMAKSDIFQDMHNLATSLNPQGDLEPEMMCRLMGFRHLYWKV